MSSQNSQFHSLRYQDMPFVMAPTFWSSLSRHSRVDHHIQERAHQDGLLVNAESVEALEEVFWKTYSQKKYLKSNRLKPHTVSKKEQERYRTYIACILSQKEKSIRYLSKNNNHLLRLKGLKKCFPQAHIIVMIRDPLTHALSLLRQHRYWCGRHQDDLFSLKYMQWLVHHEFGLDHRPFTFPSISKDQIPFKLNDFDPNHLGYWLTLWWTTYTYLWQTSVSVYWLKYEDLCTSPQQTLKTLTESLKLREPLTQASSSSATQDQIRSLPPTPQLTHTDHLPSGISSLEWQQWAIDCVDLLDQCRLIYTQIPSL